MERLAEAACVSSRQFARIFLKETGETPARAVERLRAEVARAKVEDISEPIEHIARQVGSATQSGCAEASFAFTGTHPKP